MTHRELKERLSGSEFVMWAAFLSIEAKEQERAQRQAQNRSKARQMSRSLNS